MFYERKCFVAKETPWATQLIIIVLQCSEIPKITLDKWGNSLHFFSIE
jgi:hypothetical protein